MIISRLTNRWQTLATLHSALDPIELTDAIHAKLQAIQKPFKQALSLRNSA
jgi:hypothetical protein